MYINSEYEALFLDFIKKSGLAPISIKNIRSDIVHFFKWWRSQGKTIEFSCLKDNYEQFLIAAQLNERTLMRRISSLNKFLNWVNSNFHQPSYNNPNVSISFPEPHSLSPKKSGIRVPTYLLILTIVCVLALFFFFIKNTFHIKSTKIEAARPPLFLSFDLMFGSNSELLYIAKYPISFNFYSDSGGTYSIGNTICLVPPPPPAYTGSRLKINLGIDCGTLPASVIERLASNDDVFVDILSNNINLSSSKILITDQSHTFNKLTYQNDTNNVQNNNSRSDSSVPNTSFIETKLPFSAALESSTSAKIADRVLLSSITNGSSFEEGDVVGLYNGTFDKALLSTKVIGVVANNAIQESGVVEVNILEPSVPIAAGDLISTSLEPGYAQKSVMESDNVFGISIEGYATGSGKLRVLLRPE